MSPGVLVKSGVLLSRLRYSYRYTSKSVGICIKAALCGGDVVGVQLQSVLGTEFAKQGKFVQKSKRFDMDICCYGMFIRRHTFIFAHRARVNVRLLGFDGGGSA